MEYSIEKIDETNYPLFDDMVFFRINGRERNADEQMRARIDAGVYKTLKNKNLYIFAAKTDNKFIGWISLVYIPKVGRTNGRGYLYVDELWVNPAYRKNGIAYSLMEKGNIISNELDTLGLRLYVNTDNDEAFSLYKKCGYKVQRNAIFMEKESS
jgi:ribosomal protein S18 acetylase RimI-like enzyme